ncbi:unnamed protein product [Peniophora sp. CBMAI 1063]|nr:unnamed protein product [Peniophora sp. CBMAI 1063]
MANVVAIQAAIAQEAQAVLDYIERREITPSQATRRILDIADRHTNRRADVTPDQYDTVVKWYLETIDRVVAQHHEADQRARERERAASPRRERARSRARTPSPGPEPADPRGRKRARSASPGSDAGADVRTTKLEFSYAQLPFGRAAGKLARAFEDPHLQKTYQLKANYLADLAAARIELFLDPDTPPLPEQLWNNILRNQYVDLDSIFTGYYATNGDARGTEKLGDFEVVSQSSKPSRRVTTQSDWILAFELYREAVVHAYPHRRGELSTYQRYVSRLFAATPGYPERVISFDRAVRTRSGRDSSLLLSNNSSFDDLLTLHVTGPSAGGSSSRNAPKPQARGSGSGSGSSGGRNPEPCIRHNEGRCNNGSNCRYAHVCSDCRSNRHVASDYEIDNRGPRLFRRFLWEQDSSLAAYRTPCASATETADPLPSPPLEVLNDPVARGTIERNPHLFAIVTPIHVPAFERALRTHPNRPFVDSVIRGLKEGFWPHTEGYDQRPLTRDYPQHELAPKELAFAKAQAQAEEDALRFSPPFDDLEPGMINVPVHVVPKKAANSFRLVVDHSLGEFAPNSFIPKHAGRAVLDSVQDLGHNMLTFRKHYGGLPLRLFKSDVAKAYRCMPMHPFWQIGQVVTIDGRRRVDRCNNFGGRESGVIFGAFMGLVLWIARERGIEALNAFVDDNFSFDASGELEWYAPYKAYFPPKQVALLRLWDELGIPHEFPKQEHGSALPITGILVDAEAMTLSLDAEARCDFAAAVTSFLATPSRAPPLVAWERLIGWANWAINVAPLLRPALSSSYAKTSGKTHRNAPVPINSSVARDLRWLADTLTSPRWDGISLVTARLWSPEQADLVLYCDASTSVGMGFWCPSRNLGFAAENEPAPAGAETIFWFEALTVLRALAWAGRERSPPTRLAIYTDNLNSVQIFNSFKATGAYNDILLLAAQILLETRIDLRVFHVPGVHNTVADCLSRGLFETALGHAPYLRIHAIPTPRRTLGVASC